LLVAGRLADPVARVVAVLAVVSCLAGPAAYSVATAAASHAGAIPSVGPARHGPGGGFTGPGGLLDSPDPGAVLSATLASADYTWAGAVIGSNNAAGYQLASGAPIMAIGGFNGTDPSPTLDEFKRYVADRQIHYFIRGKIMIGHWGGAAGGSTVATEIADWVETHYAPQTVDRVVVYDLTQRPKDS